MAELSIECKLRKMAADVGADFSFDWVKITICINWVNLEVGFAGPAFRRRTVSHAENTILFANSAG